MSVKKLVFLLVFLTLCFAVFPGSPDLSFENNGQLISAANQEPGSFHKQIKLFGFLFLLLIIFIFSLFLRKNRSLTNDLTETSRSAFITIKTGRLLLFLGAFIIPATAVSFSIITKTYGIDLNLSVCISLMMLGAASGSYASDWIQKNIAGVVIACYSIVVLFYTYLVLHSSLSSFFIISQIISISVGTIIFNKTWHFVFFSILVALLSAVISFIVQAPSFSPALYMLAIISILFVSITTTHIRLSLSDKLIFSDTVINDGSSLVMAANKNGEIIYVNKTFTMTMGYTEEELLGKGWWKVRKALANDNNPFDKIRRGEIESTATVLFETKSKDKRWIQWNNTRLKNGVFVGIGTDITDRREYEQRFRQLVENAKDMIYTTDNKGNFSYMNDVAALYTGYEKNELIGRNFSVLVDDGFKREISFFYNEQIKNKNLESYNEFPFRTKAGELKWIGQSTLYKYDAKGEYVEAQVICRDVNERVLAEEKLKQHNKDLNVINLVKEIILASQDPPSMYKKILLLLSANSDKTNFFSINIFSKVNNDLHSHSLEASMKDAEKNTFSLTTDERLNLRAVKKTIIDLKKDNDEVTLYRNLRQPIEKYSSAVILPIENAKKIYGFVAFYSLMENAYQTDHYIMVRDICTSLASFFVQYEQNEIIKETNRRIENYSKQLEILNESKARLISYDDLNSLYSGIIGLLYEKIENIFRVSILVHDFEKGIGNLIYQDQESRVIDSKIIPIKNVPTVSSHLRGELFEKENFDTDPDLNDEDKYWHAKGVKTVISLPIMIQGKLFASVNLLSKIPYNFSEQQKAIIREINESAATVIQQIQYNEIIEAKNKDISDNINYARRIQSALMPNEGLLQSFLPESLLIFNQRDSLGGDFYWFEKKNDNIFIAVGDCTGHGVSGSLLTILASDFIKQAVEEKQFTDPALILEYLNSSLQNALNKYRTDEEILDGLDISFGVYNTKTKLFLYSGAIHSFNLARNNELIEYKGNRKPIGGANVFEQESNFMTHIVQLKTGDVVYFTTDGYLDQFHYKTEKRFGRIRLKQLLLNINDKPISEQKSVLLEEHNKWKGQSTQTDDICFLAFKVSQ